MKNSVRLDWVAIWTIKAEKYPINLILHQFIKELQW